MNELEVTRKQKQQRQLGWNLGAPPVCHCYVRYNQSCGHFAICCHSTMVLLVLLREEPVLLQQRRFFVNNCRPCDVMSITACICFSCVPAEATLRLGCWQHLFPFVQSVTTCFSISHIYNKLNISLFSALFLHSCDGSRSSQCTDIALLFVLLKNALQIIQTKWRWMAAINLSDEFRRNWEEVFVL